jgi:hypothetical protein
MRLAIADPPYPPHGKMLRASRWYGYAQFHGDVPADQHETAHEWDDPARHRKLLTTLVDGYDGWAIATTPDGIAAYGTLPAETKLMAWVRRSAEPGAHRLHSLWEAVILYPPATRRSNRATGGMVPDVLIADKPRNAFRGAKPLQWTTWVLDALGYNADTDTVDDMFPGSGMVTTAIGYQRLPFAMSESEDSDG